MNEILKKIISQKQASLYVCYATDDNYIMQVGVSLLSLLENNKEFSEINIFILDDNISAQNKKLLKKLCQLYKREIIFIDVSEKLKKIADIGAKEWFNGSFSTYARIYIADLIPKEIKKILYLDGDTIIDKSISNLWKIDLKDYALAGVLEAGNTKLKKAIGLKIKDNYFNAGVLMIDLENYRKYELKNKIIKHLQTIRTQYPYVDQDLININCQEYIKKISPIYNSTANYFIWNLKHFQKMFGFNKNNFYSLKELDDAKNNPVIIHYAGYLLGRPWESNNIHPFNQNFNHYLYSQVSPWNSYNKIKSKINLCTKTQRFLYQFTPRSFYAFINYFFSSVNIAFIKHDLNKK